MANRFKPNPVSAYKESTPISSEPAPDAALTAALATLQQQGREFVSPSEFVLLSGLSSATVARYLDKGDLPKY